VELLGDGAGLLVERGDADGIARALRRVLTEPLLAERLSGRAEHLSPGLSWRSVAGEYLHLTARLRRRPPAAHIRARHPVGALERPHRERSVVA
jgi:glycosyltransferase involved in cell wall biosynthesis